MINVRITEPTSPGLGEGCIKCDVKTRNRDSMNYQISKPSGQAIPSATVTLSSWATLDVVLKPYGQSIPSDTSVSVLSTAEFAVKPLGQSIPSANSEACSCEALTSATKASDVTNVFMIFISLISDACSIVSSK